MFIEIKEIGPEGLEIDRLIAEFPPLPLDGSEVVRVGEIHLTGQLRREAAGVDFAGDIETAATVTCSRCLEAYRLPLALHFRLFYTTSPDATGRKERRVDEESVTLTRYDGVRLDVRSLLSEQIYLGLPLKPLCTEDCRGLCARCGTNLNQRPCDCREQRIDDPRLQVLKTLL
jgi:DUF177 domain-containing protein